MGVRLLLEEVARLLRITFSLSDANCQEFLQSWLRRRRNSISNNAADVWDRRDLILNLRETRQSRRNSIPLWRDSICNL